MDSPPPPPPGGTARISRQTLAWSTSPKPPSGTNPALSRSADGPAQVACPHCAKRYPLKRSLMGRNVRCSGCRAIFTVSDAGVVTLVQRPPSSATHQQHAEGKKGTAATSPRKSAQLKALTELRTRMRAATQRIAQAAAEAAVSLGDDKALSRRVSRADHAISVSGMSHAALRTSSSATHSRTIGAQGRISPARLTGSGVETGR